MGADAVDGAAQLILCGGIRHRLHLPREIEIVPADDAVSDQVVAAFGDDLGIWLAARPIQIKDYDITSGGRNAVFLCKTLCSSGVCVYSFSPGFSVFKVLSSSLKRMACFP